MLISVHLIYIMITLKYFSRAVNIAFCHFMTCRQGHVTSYTYRKRLVQPVVRNLTLSECLLLFNHTWHNNKRVRPFCYITPTALQTLHMILNQTQQKFFHSKVHKTGQRNGHVTRRLERRQGCSEVTERCGSRRGGARENKLATTFPVLNEHLQSSGGVRSRSR